MRKPAPEPRSRPTGRRLGGAALLLVWGWLGWLLLVAALLAAEGVSSAVALVVAFPPVLLLFAHRHVRAQATALEQLRSALQPAVPDTASVLGRIDGLGVLPGELDAVKLDIRRLIDGAVATEEAIRASTTATQSILNSSQDAVLGIGPDGECLFANSRCHELVGVPVGTLIGTSVHDAIHARILGVADPDGCRFCSARTATDFQNFYNEALQSADGTVLDIDYHSFPVKSDAHSFSWVVTMTDISERRAIERRYESLVATLPVGIYNLDPAGRLVYANGRFFELVGVPREELLGEPLTRILHPDDAPAAEKTLAETMERGEPFLIEHRLRRADGRALWVLSSGNAHRDRAGEIVGVNGIYTDISDRKLAQAELEELNATLESRIEERTAELRFANTELRESMVQLQRTQEALIESEKMAALGNLVAGLAHEINTPIGISKGAASHLAAAVADFQAHVQESSADGDRVGKLGRVLTESADLIQSNLSRAANLIARFKRVSVDQSFADERHFSLLENINDAVASFSRELADADVTVDVQCDGQLQIWGDPGCYTQMHAIVLRNALDHAFSALSAGGDRSVGIEVRSREAALTIIYRDNGRGVTDEVRRHLFEPFFTTRRHNGGTGLGLHILYLLVTKTLGGRVSCEDAGQGMLLRVELPISATAHGSPVEGVAPG